MGTVESMSWFNFTQGPLRGGPDDRPERNRGWRGIRMTGAPLPSPKTEWLALAGFLALPLLVGIAGAVVTFPAVQAWYPSLVHPPGTPPASVFGPVWTVLYVMMGVAGWLVWRRVARAGATPSTLRPLRLWGWQLGLNALWSPLFFGLHSIGLGLVTILPMVVLVAWTVLAFRRRDALAAWLMTPYLLWVCYATYLNAGLLILNPRG